MTCFPVILQVDLLGEDLLRLVESDDEPSHSVGPDQRNERDTAKAVGKKKRKKKKTKKGQDSVPSGAECVSEDATYECTSFVYNTRLGRWYCLVSYI